MQPCRQCQRNFEIRTEDLEFYAKFNVPNPTLCHYCKLETRLNFRNERTLYKRKSDLSDKEIISIYSPDNRYKVYATDEWWSDKWDGLNYGQDFDFSKSFFDQFQELLLKVPRIALFNVNPYNSDYCQQAYNNKNCYLCTVVTQCEDSMYLAHTNKADSSYDCSYTQNIQLCYDCIDSDKLYGCVSCQSCQNSNGLYFCYDCIGCQDCFGSSGLRNKKYYIFNKEYSKEEYFEKLQSLETHKFSQFKLLKEHFQNIAQAAIHRENRNLNCENCLGNYLINSKNCYMCFDSFEIEDCSNCTWIFTSNDCQDVYGMGGSELVYESLGVENLNFGAFNTFVSDSSNVFYSDCCFYSSYLFGCAGLKNKKYCILNKQYTKEEYEELVPKIIEHMSKPTPPADGHLPLSRGGHELPLLNKEGSGKVEWGKFFPTSLSPFAYNESMALFYFPLTKEEALAKSYQWRDEDSKNYLEQSYEIPDSIKQVPDSIINEILSCIDCKKNYKIMLQELKFYRQQNLPIPRKCNDCRYKDQMETRNPIKLFDRNCMKCSAEIKTTYSSDRPEIVYCEDCYLDAVY